MLFLLATEVFAGYTLGELVVGAVGIVIVVMFFSWLFRRMG